MRDWLTYFRSPRQGIVREMDRERRLCTMRKPIAIRELRYRAFWGREPEVFHPTDDFEPHIDVFRFPPLGPSWFLKRWMTPAVNEYVYITGGMSDATAPGAASSKEPVLRTELTAYSNKIYLSEAGDGERQLIEEDSMRLIDRFEAHGIGPIFNLERRPCIQGPNVPWDTPA